MDIKKLFEGLKDIELDYVLHRSQVDTNAAALRLCGWNQNTFYSLPESKRDDLNRRADELRNNRILKAALILQNAVEDAAVVKVDGLRSRKDNIKQAVASEILDRTLGKAIQRQEITGADGGPIPITKIEIVGKQEAE